MGQLGLAKETDRYADDADENDEYLKIIGPVGWLGSKTPAQRRRHGYGAFPSHLAHLEKPDDPETGGYIYFFQTLLSLSWLV
jgi:hypothetical protein